MRRLAALAVVAALASSKLTVALVFAAIGIVMVGTLAQVQMDIWEVIDGYFRAWVCWVELKVLFPVSFFPWAAQTDWDSLRINGFPFPGGALIGLGLVINLAAAHAVRFKVKARGARLAWGLLVLAAGVATTWLVIEAGHNRHGVQGEPLLEWPTLWLLIRTGLVGLWLACLSGLVQMSRSGNRKGTVELGWAHVLPPRRPCRGAVSRTNKSIAPPPISDSRARNKEKISAPTLSPNISLLCEPS